MLNMLRDERLSAVWTLLRVWLGYQWLQAGLHKISDPNWMQSGVALKGYWSVAVGALPNSTPTIKYEWYKTLIDGLLNGGHYTWFAKIVSYGEVLTGIALILGAATVFALAAGAFMNFNYMLSGSASSNPVLYSVALLLIITGPPAYKYGIDRFILPFLRRTKSQKVLTGKYASASK